MLKKLYFDGMLIVDVDEKVTRLNPFVLAEILRQAIENDGSEGISHTLKPVKSFEDIPDEWKVSFPFCIDCNESMRTCAEIFESTRQENLQAPDDKNQMKFDFFDKAVPNTGIK